MARDPIQVLDERAPAPTRTTAYGEDPDQVYDVRLPDRVTRDLAVVVVHGGFWRRDYDRGHASRQAQAFADAGFATAVVEYRRPGMPGGGWPGTADDVRDAVTAIRRDPAFALPLVLVGHSAGGQLVGWAAAQPWAHGLRGAVSLAGVLDLTHGAAARVGGTAIPDFLGGTPEQVPEAYAAADPAQLPPGIPVVLVHARGDEDVPFDQSERYAAAHHGPNVRLRAVAQGGHYGLIDPEHPAFAEVLAAVDLLAS
jgi:acetyl esterase/lipase